MLQPYTQLNSSEEIRHLRETSKYFTGEYCRTPTSQKAYICYLNHERKIVMSIDLINDLETGHLKIFSKNGITLTQLLDIDSVKEFKSSSKIIFIRFLDDSVICIARESSEFIEAIIDQPVKSLMTHMNSDLLFLGCDGNIYVYYQQPMAWGHTTAVTTFQKIEGGGRNITSIGFFIDLSIYLEFDGEFSAYSYDKSKNIFSLDPKLSRLLQQIGSIDSYLALDAILIYSKDYTVKAIQLTEEGFLEHPLQIIYSGNVYSAVGLVVEDNTYILRCTSKSILDVWSTDRLHRYDFEQTKCLIQSRSTASNFIYDIYSMYGSSVYDVVENVGSLSIAYRKDNTFAILDYNGHICTNTVFVPISGKRLIFSEAACTYI